MRSYGLRRGPLFLVLAICLGFVAAGISITLKAAGAPLPLFIGVVSIAFFGGGGLVTAHRLFIADQVLLFSKDGLQSKLNFDGTLPWTGITSIQPMKIQRGEYLAFSIDRDLARNMKWRGPAVWLGLQKAEFSIPLRQINGPADTITLDILALWREADHPTSSMATETAPALIDQKRSYATYGLMALLVAIFFCELIFQHRATGQFDISPRTMIQFGGDLPYRITENGEAWRMFTAPLLHASLYHIGFNLLVLFWAGSIFERIAGWKYVLGVWALAAFAGEALSIAFLDPEIVGVGASGGNMGLIAAVLVVSGRLPLQESIRRKIIAVALLIPALAGGGNVNVFAHLGGAITGALLGFMLLKTWPRDAQTPPLSRLMAAIAFGFFTVAAGAIVPIARLWGTF